MNDDPRSLFSRHGHLTTLSADLYDVGELDVPQRQCIDRHLSDCMQCRRQLAAIAAHTTDIRPPATAQPSTGSVTLSGLVLSTGLAAAAAAVLALASALLPGPQRVEPSPTGASVPLASAYTTSPNPAYDTIDMAEPTDPMDLALEVHRRRAVVDPTRAGHLAVVLVAGFDADAMDTDGDGADEILEVLHPPAVVDSRLVVSLPSTSDSRRVVALMCESPFEIAIGDALAPEEDCVQRESITFFSPVERDS